MLIQKDLVVILETSSVGQNRHFAFSVYPLACLFIYLFIYYNLMAYLQQRQKKKSNKRERKKKKAIRTICKRVA